MAFFKERVWSVLLNIAGQGSLMSVYILTTYDVAQIYLHYLIQGAGLA